MTTPKRRRERNRKVFKSIMKDFMIKEQWEATCDRHDKRCQCRYCSYYNKQWQCWREGRIYDSSLSYGEYPATLPQTEARLLEVIQHSGYPGASKKTIRQCLNEMVRDHVFHPYHDVGGSGSNRKQKYNQKPYVFPLKSMPSSDVLLFFEIERLMASRGFYETPS